VSEAWIPRTPGPVIVAEIVPDTAVFAAVPSLAAITIFAA